MRIGTAGGERESEERRGGSGEKLIAGCKDNAEIDFVQEKGEEALSVIMTSFIQNTLFGE